MSGAWVRFRLGASTADLYPGCIIGRSWRSDLVVNDPRVSEVHAVVSLRGGSLKLRRLGGNLRLFGMPIEAAVLRPGQRIALADDLEILVDDIILPEQLPAIQIGDADPIPLDGPRVWVKNGTVHSRPTSGAIEIWAVDEDWFVGSPNRPLTEPVPFEGQWLRMVYLKREDAEVPSTRARQLYQPLQILARYDTVQLRQADQPVLVLSGNPARLITELAEMGSPVSWRVVAGELWPAQPTEVLRRRWDKCLASLRGKLRAARIRPDLVRSTGGQVSLVLLGEDDLRVVP